MWQALMGFRLKLERLQVAARKDLVNHAPSATSRTKITVPARALSHHHAPSWATVSLIAVVPETKSKQK
jgi:hypothetical protein